MRAIISRLNRQRYFFVLFIKIFAIFVGLCVLFSAVYGVFSFQAIYNELEKQLFDTNINLLSLTDTTTEILFADLEKIIRSTSENATILSAVIAPGFNRTQRNYEVVKYLNATAASSGLIARITLYVEYDQTVFSSDGVATYLESFGDRSMIDRFHAEKTGTTLQGTVVSRTYDNRMFCCLDFPLSGSYRNGTLFIEVDPKAFYSKLNSQTQYSVYMFDEENQSLFNTSPPADALRLTSEHFSYMRKQGYGTLKQFNMLDHNVVYFYNAPDGWLYVYPVPLETLDQLYSTVVRMILPLFMISLLLSVVVASYVSRAIYSPIRRLTELVNSKRPSWTPSNKVVNEMEYLGMAYQDAADSNTRLAGILSRSTDALLEKMFLSLMQDRQNDPEDIEETLQALNTPIQPADTFAVLAFQVSGKDESGLSILQTDLYKASMDSLMESVSGGACRHFPVTIDAGRIAMVVAFERDEPLDQAARLMQKMAAVARREGEKLPCLLRVGLGKCYRSIYDLKYSYQEAFEVLNYQSYFNEPAGGDARDEPLSGETYFHARFQQLAQALFNAQPDSAALLTRVLDELFTQGRELPALREQVTDLIDQLYDFYGGRPQDGSSELEDRQDALRNMETLSTPQALREWTEQLCGNAAEYFSACNSRKKYRYVVRAKEYLEEHYAQATLSLNEVAENINISPTYLSRLFKEYQQRNLIDYLNELRIHRAEVYLGTTDLGINEIGFRCGFSSAQNFNRVFKRYRQTTPGQYRETLYRKS